MPYSMPGLLDDDESLLPNGGLLSAFQAPTPSLSALQQMTAAQPPAPVPSAAAPATPAAAAPPKPALPDVLSPTRSAIVAGGLQLLEDSATPTRAPMTVAQMVSSALRAGIPTLIASRQQKQSRADELSRQEQFKGMVTSALKDGTLTPEQARQASQMGADAGIKYLEGLSMENTKSKNAIALEQTRQAGDRHVVNDTLVDNSGKVQFADKPKTMLVDKNLYLLGEDGTPKKGEDGQVLPPIIAPGQQLDLANLPSDVREALSVALQRDIRDPQNFAAPLTPEDAAKVDQYINRKVATGAAKSSTTIMNDTAGAAAATGVIKSLDTSRAEADAARKDMQVTARALTTLSNPSFISGSAANARISLATLARTLGFGGGEGADNAKIYMTQIAERVLPIVRQLAPVTEEDVKLLNMVKGGDLSMSPKGLRRLLELGQQANELLIDDHNERAKASTILPEAARHDYLVPYPKGYKKAGGSEETEDDRVKRLLKGGSGG